jgi:hypothetical protein
MSRTPTERGSSTLADSRRDLLVMLLEAHERGASYGRPAPWPRDVIVKLDTQTFPEAFAPEGREIRTALFTAAVGLAAERKPTALRTRRWGPRRWSWSRGGASDPSRAPSWLPSTSTWPAN